MRCYLIEVSNSKSHYFLAEMDGRYFWAGAATNTKMPKIYTSHGDAARVLNSANTYLRYEAEKRIVEADLIVGGGRPKTTYGTGDSE